MFFLLLGYWAKQFQQRPQRIVKLINHALLQRNNRVIGDGDVFGTDFSAALGDVAVANATSLLQL
jgi:hypothetical protein